MPQKPQRKATPAKPPEPSGTPAGHDSAMPAALLEFMLQDWKRDFVDRFGELGEAVSYSTIDELQGKVDHFLSHERNRHAIAAAIADRIRREYSLAHFFERVIDRALQRVV